MVGRADPPPTGKMSTILYGKDDTPRIVAVSPHDDESVMVYFREEDGSVRKYISKSWAYFLTDADGEEKARSVQVPQWESFRHTAIPLKTASTSQFNRVISSRSHSDSRQLADYLRQEGKMVKSAGSLISQYLTQTGRTIYKGMSMDDGRRMQIDIETISPKGGFPNSERPQDEIVIISISDNHGFRNVLHTSKKGSNELPCRRFTSEVELLTELVRVILMRDPDIIEGHNIFNFDLPYIIERAKLYEVYLGIGRNNRSPRVRQASKRFAERDMEFQNVTIDGRAIIDTMFLVIEYDVFKRDMPSHGLKAAAKYFDVARAGRVYVEGDAITATWKKDPDKLLAYALDDVEETLALSSKLLPSLFELTKMVPSTLQDIHTSGVGSALSKLFTREYLRQRQAIPRPERGRQILGGMTGVAQTGVIHDLLYIDVASLYPSIMIHYTVQPESDVLGVFQSALKDLTRLRLETKKMLNDHTEGSSAYVQIDAQQSAYKRIINSFYGALGYERFEWNDLSEADRVALTGQTILVRMMSVLEEVGSKIVEADTDGIICTRPSSVTNPLQFVKEIIEPKMPKGIKLDLDGVPKTMMSYRPKNYAMLTDKGKIKIKGGAFKSRGIEKFARDWMKECIHCILFGEFNRLRQITEEVKERIVGKKMDVTEFSVRQNLKKSLAEYLDGVERLGNSRMAQYELWAKDHKRFDVGDPVFYYLTNNGQKEAYKCARLVDDYQRGSEHSAHYLRRFEEIVKKFEGFFEPSDYSSIFMSKPDHGQTDIFGGRPRPDLTGIHLPITQVTTLEDFQRTLSKNTGLYTRQYT